MKYLNSDTSKINMADNDNNKSGYEDGTSRLEISLVTSCAPIFVLLRSVFFHSVIDARKVPKDIKSTCVIYLLEYMTVVLPPFLLFTVLSYYVAVLIVVLTLFSVIVTYYNYDKSTQTINIFSIPILDKKKQFLNNFRAYVNIATAISILAVDFVIFPERFAKTKIYGTGLMDVGVGSFMIANAVVSKDARGITMSVSTFKAVKNEVRAVLVLTALGVTRFLTLKTTDYQQKVGEYGLHWNFFLTLACVRVLSTIILKSFGKTLGNQPWILGIIIGISYEIALCNGLQQYIIKGSKGDGSREGFVDANREGIFSCIGYLAVYLIGVSIGKLIFCNKYDCMKSLLKLLMSLFCIAFVCSSVLLPLEYKQLLISRCMANFSFIIWQVGYNAQLLALFLMADIIIFVFSPLAVNPGSLKSEATIKNVPEKASPTAQSHDTSQSRYRGHSHQLSDNTVDMKSAETTGTHGSSSFSCFCIITSVNYNLLAYFLLANLMTGVVNLSMDTKERSAISAFTIMNIYLLLLHAIIIIFYRNKISLKL